MARDWVHKSSRDFENSKIWNPGPEPYDPPLTGDAENYRILAWIIFMFVLVPLIYLWFDLLSDGRGFHYLQGAGLLQRIFGP